VNNLWNVEGVYPLVPLQRGLLFNSLYSPGSGVYGQQLRMTISGPLDPAIMRKAWEKIIERHSSLRTSFIWERQEEPVQAVRRRVKLPWQELDWRPFSGAEQREKLEAFLRADREKGFDFTRGPLLRITLIRTGDQAYELTATSHHIILDGWSNFIVVKELISLVRSLHEDKENDGLAGRPPAYRDYIRWVQQQNPALAESFWRKSLQGITEPTLIPGMQPGHVHGDATRQRSCELRLEPQVRERLQEFATTCGVTLTTVLAGAWALLLGCCNNREDIIFGLTVHGRPLSLPGVEEMVGLFINTLPFRTAVHPESNLSDWLQDFQFHLLELQEHAYSDLVKVHQWSDIGPGRPLFESIFVFDNYPKERATSADTNKFLFQNVHSIDTGSFPLAIIAGADEGLCLGMTYDSTRIDELYAKRLLYRYGAVLERIQQSPVQKLWEITALSHDESAQLAGENNKTHRDFGRPICLHQMFERQSAASPEAIALTLGEQQWTYRDVNERANRLALHLRRNGVRPEHRVGVYLESSADTVLAILAVLKAGGAYVPLDAGYPQQILNHMVSDAGVQIVITEKKLSANLPWGVAGLVELGTEENEIDVESGDNSSADVSPANLAYVIYTSGSTGLPKGVAVTHCNAFGVIQWFIHAFSVSSSDRMLLGVSTSFDPSVAQIFSALCSGAELVCMKPAPHDAPYILSIIEKKQVTVMDFPPSVLSLLLSDAKPEQFRSVRRVLAGGEPTPSNLLSRLFSKLPVPFSNLYGPTETCINASCWTCTAHSFAPPVSIGRPIANAKIGLLDRCLQPVPVGVQGEIFIGGAGVSRGYLNRPELTAEKFIPDPYCSTRGGRLYRTGDLARYLDDGNIEFLGRVDSQVKIRGVRIELGQVEAAAREHSAVREAAIVVRENRDNEPLLAAYVSTRQPLLDRELKAFLKTRLAQPMVPSIIMFLDQLPRLPNGKVNQKLLPAIDLESGGKTQRAPRNEWEGLLATIWANVLSRDRVSVDDNFFALGGHSLTAIRIASKVQEAFGIEFPIRLLFEKPTIAELCEAVQACAQRVPTRGFAAVSPRSHDSRVPMSFAQQRLWFLDRLAPAEPFYNLPEALRLRGTLDLAALDAALAEVLRRHSVLRTTFGVEEGELVQVISDGDTPRLQVVDLAELKPEQRDTEAKRLAEQQARRPFDLEQGPLLRSELLKLDDEDHVLLLTFHHIVADGWSVSIVGKELSALYGAFHHGAPSPLDELAIQYADFAVWQQERFTGAMLDQKLDYWKKQLAGASGVLEIQTDLPRPATQSFHGASCEFNLSVETARLLKRLGLQESATSFMMLLAAFNVLLYRYSGQADILVGAPVSGRDYPELENLVGLFVNTIVLRTDLSGEPGFRELLSRVRSTTIGAYSNQEIPFEKVIEEVNPARDLSRSPLFQVMFSFQQGGPQAARDFGNLQMSPFGVNAGTSKFDLELLITETDQGFDGILEYNTDLFLPETIAAMVRHFRNILEQGARHPDCPVSRLCLLDEKERQEITDHFSAGPTRELPKLCFHQLFESQAEKTPDDPAVIAEDGSLTYRELSAKANSAAHALMEKGLTRESIVAVLSDRGSTLLCSMLGIWKAGCAYLPLDPRYPARRLAQMLEQARVETVIVSPAWKEALLQAIAGAQRGLSINVLDSEILLADAARDNPVLDCVPEDLAYVIFTSGSTGMPKGAMVEHKGMLNHLFAKVEDLNLTAKDVVAQTASQCFDISIWQFLSALMVGGRTCVWPDAIAYNPARLLEELEKAEVSVLEVVPSLLRLILDEVDRAPQQYSLRFLRWLIPTGEALPAELVRRWLEHYPAIPMVNAYGPTECSDDVTHCPIYAGPPMHATSVPIGRPVRNMSLHVLDAHMQLLPVGVPGELFISGVGVGRGYIHNPETTVLAFCPNPISADANQVLYRTGDRVRFLRDGKLDFLGRVDHQVKVRGFRIELGETEFRLRQHPGVRDCAVVDTKDAESNTQLVAYVVLDQQSPPSVEDLRKFLKLSVPEYMVPSLILVLKALPLTASGKLDRKALPKPDLDMVARSPFAAPQTQIERRLARILEGVLHTSSIGIHDSFFDLGGHSILALRLMGEIQNRFGRKLPLTTLFQHGTIKELAAILEETFSQAPSSPLIAMQPSGTNPPIFFVHVGSGEVMCYLDLVRHLGRNQPFYGLQDPNLYSDSVVEMSLEKRAALYLDAVRSEQPRGPYFLGGWSFGGLTAFEMARQLRARGETVGLLALLDTGSPDFVRQMSDPDDDAALLGIIARELNVRVRDADLRRLSLEEKFQFVAERMKDVGLHWVDSESFLARQLAIFKSRNRVINQYYPSPYDGTITFFRASREYVEDPSRPEITRDPTRGFEALTTQPIDLHIIPGNHHQIAHEPGVQALAAALSGSMNKALRALDLQQ
jgi:amino acid adenylation domain-containing protein